MTTELRLFGPRGPVLDPAGWAPGGVRGADKVAQRVLYALLTPQGSVPGRPADGSPFLALAAAFRSEFDLYAAWAAAEPAVVATVQAAELPTDPPADRLGAVRLDGLAVVADAVTLTVGVAAADGSVPAAPVEFDLPT